MKYVITSGIESVPFLPLIYKLRSSFFLTRSESALLIRGYLIDSTIRL
jgi:hypothetical protein